MTEQKNKKWKISSGMSISGGQNWFEDKLNGRNKIMAPNTCTVSIMRYGTGIPKWNKNELQEMDRETRKFMTMNKEFHWRSDVARLCVSRKNGGRGIIECENGYKEWRNWLRLVHQKQYRTITSCSQNK